MTNRGRAALFGATVLVLCAAWAQAGDIDTLLLRLRADYLTGSSSGANTYLANMAGDGSWTDIDYADRSRTAWAPNEHVNRLRRMATAYGNAGNARYHDPAMRAAIVKGLEFWFTRKPVSDNWWHNDIGQQLQLGPMLVMMRDSLPPALVDTGCTYLNDPQTTGQNLVWYATQTVQRGSVRGFLPDVAKGLDAIKNEVRVTTSEGIQPDYCFHQHGPQLYNGGYGRGFVSDVSYWIYMTRGLSFAFPAAKVDILSGLILDGTQWMVRRGTLDFACQGREISRPNSGGAGGFGSALSRMAALGTDRREEFLAFDRHIAGADDTALTGNRHFWRADYQAHRRIGFHASVKMCSDRTTGTEYMNSENRRGYYLPFGATVIMRTGSEYYNLYPVWDWAHIPGTTAPHKTPPPNMSTYIRGTTAFVGGASNGRCGVAAMDLSWDGVKGKKAWFFLGDAVVALGAGISASGTVPVHTTINQCRLRDAVWAAPAGMAAAELSKGERTLPALSWVWHDSVGYVFGDAGQAVVRNDQQSGNWQSINSTYSAATITDSVFSVWIDHGAAPAGATYEYTLLPGVDRVAAAAFVEHSPIRTIANDTAVQAVRDSALALNGIVFHKAGEVVVHGDLEVRVDLPCVLLVDESGSDILVTAANPRNQAATLNVTLAYRGRPGGRLVIELPDGGSAGSSVTAAYPVWAGAGNQRPPRDTRIVGFVPLSGGLGLVLSLARAGRVDVELARTDGRRVARAGGTFAASESLRFRLPAVGLAPGLYLMRVTTSSGTLVRSIALPQ